MALSDRMKATVTRLTKPAPYYGTSGMTLTVNTGSVFVPEEGGYTTTTPTVYNIQGIELKYKIEEVDNDTILGGDKKLLVAATLSIEPPVNAVVAISGKTYRVMSVEPMKVQGIPIGYTLQLRGG